MADEDANAQPSALRTIGDTPLVKLMRLPPEGAADVWVKLEYFNPTGSYKDRMALSVVEGAEARGELTPGGMLVEGTGGSTGTSLAFVASVKGYRFKVVSSDAFAAEKRKSMKAFGAELVIVPSESGKITADLIAEIMNKAERISRDEHGYLTRQFTNPDVPRGYQPMGEEILRQIGGAPSVFCAGVGTAGMLMGVATALRRAGAQTRIVALEPAESPMLTEGSAGPHGVEGIGVGKIPPLLDRALVDEVRCIAEATARETARALAAQEGIFAGVSSGLNVAAAIEIARELGAGHTVVTTAVDSGMKYLAGDLFD